MKCPKCGVLEMECTTMGNLLGEDTNTHNCTCGWEGTKADAASYTELTNKITQSYVDFIAADIRATYTKRFGAEEPMTVERFGEIAKETPGILEWQCGGDGQSRQSILGFYHLDTASDD